MKQTIIAGCLADSKTRAPLAGRKIHVVDDSTDEVLLETYTSNSGEYRANLSVGLVSKGDRKVSIRAVDEKGNAVGGVKGIKLQPWQEVVRDIKVDESDLSDSLDTIPELETVAGSIIDPEVKKVIAQAVGMIAPSGTPEYARMMNMANCPLPPIDALDTLVQDAWSVIEGDPVMINHFRSTMNMFAEPIDGRAQLKTFNQPSGGGGCGCGGAKAMPQQPSMFALQKKQMQKSLAGHGMLDSPLPRPFPIPGSRPCIVPLNRFVPIASAAMRASRTLDEANVMMGAIQNGLCGLERFDHIYQTARITLETGEISRLRGVIERYGWECGPDDGPIPVGPNPNPEPTPWPRPRPCPPDPVLPPPHDCIPGYLDCIRDLADAFQERNSGNRQSYEITSISPSAGCPGETITISGSNFGSIAGKVCFTSSAGSRTCVSAVSWSDTEIQVVVPDGAGEGYITLRIMEESIRVCGHFIPVYRFGNEVTFVGGSAVIRSLSVNYGSQNICIEPGGDARISWAAAAGSSVDVQVKRGSSTVFSESNQPASGQVTYTLPSNINSDRTYTVTVTSSNTCGSDSKSLDFTVTVRPQLTIEGIEITQGIQQFWRPGSAPNSIPVISGKDTIARVYISCDRNGFNNDQFGQVTGTLRVGSMELTPINGITPTSATGSPFITARARANINRSIINHTLNFRIPANLANGTKTLEARVGGEHTPCDVTVTAFRAQTQTWQDNNALRVRYVRIRDNGPGGNGATPTNAQCTYTVNRGFDLFPTPATNIAAARVSIWTTTRDFTNSDNELRGLLNDLDDEHNCSAWETFLSWFGGDDCPEPDNAEWVGLTTRRQRGWATGGNTCLSAIYVEANGQGDIMRIKTAHELGHNVGFCHDQAGGAPGACRNVGTIADVPFDPYWNQTVTGTVTDIMGYGTTRYVHEQTWNDLISNI